MGDSAVQMRIFSPAMVERFRKLLKNSLKIQETGENFLNFKEIGENSVEILLNFAIGNYKKSLEFNPKCAGSWQSLGLAYFFLARFSPKEDKKVQLAIDSFVISLKINPANTDCWKTVNQKFFGPLLVIRR